MPKQAVIKRYRNFQETPDQFSHVCFADSETTGLYPDVDEMIQFCLITNDKTFIWYIHPEHNAYDATLRKFQNAKNINWQHHQRIMDLSYGRVRLANVLNSEMAIKYDLSPRQFALELANALQGQVVVMHNGIRFDAQFVNNLFASHGISCDWACLDSMLLAKELALNTPNARYNQGVLGDYYRIPNDDAHDAYGDTKQLIRIFRAMIQDQERKGIEIQWYEQKG